MDVPEVSTPTWSYEAVVETVAAELVARGHAERVQVDRVAHVLGERLLGWEPQSPITSGFRTVKLAIGGQGQASSTKLSNASLRLGECLEAVAGGVLATAAASAHPWTIALAILVAVQAVRKALTVQIDERTATVLWSIWVNRDEACGISAGSALLVVNEERVKQGHVALTQSQFDDAMSQLVTLGCVQARSDGSGWAISEKIVLDP